uniref:Uncharacterized protein n=1 Tax=Romanomermis culicivorax TaxID=13658 RepID=A0A915IBU4_ROMCU
MGNSCTRSKRKLRAKKQASSQTERSDSDNGGGGGGRSNVDSKSKDQTATEEFMIVTPSSEKKASPPSDQKSCSLDSQVCPFVMDPLPKNFVVNDIWKVQNEIGIGAFGHVYKVTDRRTRLV